MTSQAPIVPIVGGGPAGMSCALWLHNYALRPIIIERDGVLGGMARRSPYPNEWLLGRAGESARENAAAFAAHIRRLSIPTWLSAQPHRLCREHDGAFRLDLACANASSTPLPAQPLLAAALVIATGTRFAGEEWLDAVANARETAARGRLHIGAPWAGEPGVDLGTHVAVIGGGDNAFDVSRMLVEKGVRATIVMRSQEPRARPLMVERLRRHEPSGTAQLLPRRTVHALEDAAGRVHLRLDGGDHFEADHVLLLLGYRPNSDASFMAALELAKDERGYIAVDGNMQTSCPGVFAVGDVASPAHPCIATAIGSGTMAAREIGRRLQRFPVE
jgi:thioredoxin reductase (NADPH)